MWDGRTPVLIEFAVWLGALSHGCYETSAESWVSAFFWEGAPRVVWALPGLGLKTLGAQSDRPMLMT